MKKMAWILGAVLGIVVLLGTNTLFAEDAPKGGCPMKGCFEKMDTDKNGQISEAEFLECSKTRFVSMDTDKNGSLSKEELKPSCMTPMAGEMKPMAGKECPYMKEGAKK